MPRTQRKLANSGIYHIVFKGINHEKIFQENSKKRMIIKIMLEKRQETELEIFAYCIMPTHVHILIRGKMEEISRFLSRTEITFAMRYNQGKERNGHLFQNRFFSQAIENEVYFWNCIKYIHNNPVKAGLASAPPGICLFQLYGIFDGKPIFFERKRNPHGAAHLWHR